jgi:hypothetical protein
MQIFRLTENQLEIVCVRECRCFALAGVFELM